MPRQHRASERAADALGDGRRIQPRCARDGEELPDVPCASPRQQQSCRCEVPPMKARALSLALALTVVEARASLSCPAEPWLFRDPAGIGALHEGPSRSPDGLMYATPPLRTTPAESAAGWS